mgnify:CR=1 FL=1
MERDKNDLKDQIRTQIQQLVRERIDLFAAGSNAAAQTARAADGAMQSKSDTTQIQNSWLADGLARLAGESQAKLALLENQQAENNSQKVSDDSLVAVVDNKKSDQEIEWFFLSPAAAGGRIQLEDGRSISIISPQSPLGSNLLGKSEGDTVSYQVKGTTGRTQEFFIKSVV